MNRNIKLMILDNHPFVVCAICDYLDKVDDFEVIEKTNDGQKVLTSIEKCKPDVIIMDPFLKNGKGIELVKTIKNTYKDSIKIIIFTDYNCNEFIKIAYQLGIHAYLLKEEPFEKVINAIRQSYLGNVLLPHHLIMADSAPHNLTMTEIEILHLISKEKNNQEIAKDLHISKRTVEYHITSIYQKMGVYTRVGAIMRGMEKGILYL
ncbi:response regulator transcription factor [Schinkia azotoformans]|uniref:response regulator transcription factor n=1 Tax=Schinkia azotoformans TaxID=1454 RepID=UPI002DB9D4F6|nr:response regulator transcription factor [Schinkia azotoformans]MEC1722578.1 response regulator transcription factor [Schinkia azotoformans]MED4354334.1 response regulator transcription factor [Schinkia azotoformans]MED4412046.1 response regulator transcription factor [Schinkia azotoformans]